MNAFLSIVFAFSLSLPAAFASGGGSTGSGGGTGVNDGGQIDLFDLSNTKANEADAGLNSIDIEATPGFLQILAPRLKELAKDHPDIARRIALEIHNEQWRLSSNPLNPELALCGLHDRNSPAAATLGKSTFKNNMNYLSDEIALLGSWWAGLSPVQQADAILKAAVSRMQGIAPDQCDQALNDISSAVLGSGDINSALNTAGISERYTRAQYNASYAKVKDVLDSACNSSSGDIDFTGFFPDIGTSSYCKLTPAPCYGQLSSFMTDEFGSSPEGIQVTSAFDNGVRIFSGERCKEVVGTIRDQFYAQDPLSDIRAFSQVSPSSTPVALPSTTAHPTHTAPTSSTHGAVPTNISSAFTLSALTAQELAHPGTTSFRPFDQAGVQQILIPKLKVLAKRFPKVAKMLLDAITNSHWYKTTNPIERSYDDCSLTDSGMVPLGRQVNGNIVVQKPWVDDPAHGPSHIAQIVLHEAVEKLSGKSMGQCAGDIQELTSEIWNLDSVTDDQIQSTLTDVMPKVPLHKIFNQARLDREYQTLKPYLDSSCGADGTIDFRDIPTPVIHQGALTRSCHDAPDFYGIAMELKEDLPPDTFSSLQFSVDDNWDDCDKFLIHAGAHCAQVKQVLIDQVLDQNPALDFPAASTTSDDSDARAASSTLPSSSPHLPGGRQQSTSIQGAE